MNIHPNRPTTYQKNEVPEYISSGDFGHTYKFPIETFKNENEGLYKEIREENRAWFQDSNPKHVVLKLPEFVESICKKKIIIVFTKK